MNGNPKFLTFISYFGGTIRPTGGTVAAREALAQTDAHTYFPLFCANGFNGIRMFVDFWYHDGYSAGGGHKTAADAVIRPDGFLNDGLGPDGIPGTGDDTPDRLTNLFTILDIAKSYGLVVDLSFAWETVSGRTQATQVAGITRLATRMSQPGNDVRFNHVMFDVQNELNATGVATANIPNAIAAGKATHPSSGYTRIVFMSSAGQSEFPPATGPTSVPPGGTFCYPWRCLVDVALGGGMVIAPHESRFYETAPYPFGANPWWNTWVTINIQKALVPGGNGVPASPIYLQEPDRWMQAYPSVNPCSPNVAGPGVYVENPCELGSFDLTNSATHAFHNGAAAWTFHTEYFFFPGTGLRVAGIPEQQVMGLLPGSGQSLRGAFGMGTLGYMCWGASAESYWIAGWTRPGQWTGPGYIGDCSFAP